MTVSRSSRTSSGMVRGIRPVSRPGRRSRCDAAATARQMQASRHRALQRCQDRRRITWRSAGSAGPGRVSSTGRTSRCRYNDGGGPVARCARPAGDAQEAIARVRAVHQAITGTGPGGRPYAASDPRLLTWVHIAETGSFLRAHARFGAQPLDQAGRDGYVSDMARIGAGLGVPDPPRTEAELTARINACRPELAATAQARDAARFLLLHPPLPVIARAPYAVLAAAAVSLLPGWARRQLRLPRLPVSEAVLVRPAGHAMVHAIRWAISAPAAPPQSPHPTSSSGDARS